MFLVQLEAQKITQPHRTDTPVSERILESQRNLDETAELYKSIRAASSISNDTKCMERVREHLESVMVCIS